MARIEDFEDHCWADVIDADTISVYSNYKRETRVGERPAVIAIDLYRLVYQGGPRPPVETTPQHYNTCGQFAYDAIEPAKKLLAAARRARLPIFYCTQETRPQNRPWGVNSTRITRKIDPEMYEIYHEFTPQPEDVIIKKQRASIFQGTPIVSHLNFLGIRSLIVCGESTSGCVRASCVDAYSNGYHVSLVEEATYDRSALIHKVNLFDLHHKYVDVMKVDEVVAHLDGLSSPASMAAE
ncbi:MAG: isochorismatase family protein [Hyphomicrobiaceae bacterium]